MAASGGGGLTDDVSDRKIAEDAGQCVAFVLCAFHQLGVDAVLIFPVEVEAEGTEKTVVIGKIQGPRGRGSVSADTVRARVVVLIQMPVSVALHHTNVVAGADLARQSPGCPLIWGHAAAR